MCRIPDTAGSLMAHKLLEPRLGKDLNAVSQSTLTARRVNGYQKGLRAT